MRDAHHRHTMFGGECFETAEQSPHLRFVLGGHAILTPLLMVLIMITGDSSACR